MPLIKSPIPSYFNPEHALKAKGKGWALASSATSEAPSQDENELSTGTVLHFAHPKLIEIATEMLMVFPQPTISPFLKRTTGRRNDNIIVAPTVLVCYSVSFRRSISHDYRWMLSSIISSMVPSGGTHRWTRTRIRRFVLKYLATAQHQQGLRSTRSLVKTKVPRSATSQH